MTSAPKRVEYCTRCGRPLNERDAVWLELDQRTNTYHDFGGIPEDQSQGGFIFGSDCADRERDTARAASTDTSQRIAEQGR